MKNKTDSLGNLRERTWERRIKWRLEIQDTAIWKGMRAFIFSRKGRSKGNVTMRQSRWNVWEQEWLKIAWKEKEVKVEEKEKKKRRHWGKKTFLSTAKRKKKSYVYGIAKKTTSPANWTWTTWKLHDATSNKRAWDKAIPLFLGRTIYRRSYYHSL